MFCQCLLQDPNQIIYEELGDGENAIVPKSGYANVAVKPHSN